MVGREFVFTDSDFKRVKTSVFDLAGISLSDHKFQMVYSRLARRLRAVGINKVKDYLDLVEDNTEERVKFINAVTTNLTYFFRENHHFEFVSSTLLKQWENTHSHDKKIRIWSAGCSTGEEPYTLAYSIDSLVSKFPNWDIKILATDLDTNVLAKAKLGVYSEEKLEKISPKIINDMFVKTESGFQVKQKFKDCITFKQLNLMEPWPMRGKFDLIFCRNVLIYFNKDTQQKLLSRYAELLHDSGVLILGHSESIGAQGTYFKSFGKTIFQKHGGD